MLGVNYNKSSDQEIKCFVHFLLSIRLLKDNFMYNRACFDKPTLLSEESPLSRLLVSISNSSRCARKFSSRQVVSQGSDLSQWYHCSCNYCVLCLQNTSLYHLSQSP